MPDGNEVVAIVNDGGWMGGTVPIGINSGVLAVAGGDWESLTCTVKLEVPAVIGVPEIAPLLAFSVKPVGKLPWMTLQV